MNKPSVPSALERSMAEFLDDDLWMLSWNASVQRKRLYAVDASTRDRTNLSVLLHSLARELVSREYQSAVSEAQHCDNIERVIEEATTEHARNLGLHLAGPAEGCSGSRPLRCPRLTPGTGEGGSLYTRENLLRYVVGGTG